MSGAAPISRPTSCSYANAMTGYVHLLAGQVEEALKLFRRGRGDRAPISAGGLGDRPDRRSRFSVGRGVRVVPPGCGRSSRLRSAWADFSLMWFLRTAFHRTDAARDPNFLEYDFEPEMSSEQPGQPCTFAYVAYQE